MNIREGVRRLLVVVSVVAIIPAAVDSYDLLTAPEPSAYWERQELAQCAKDRGGMKDPQLQFALAKEGVELLSNGFHINPFEQFGSEATQLIEEDAAILADLGYLTAKEKSHVLYTVCKQESDRFLAAANSIMVYRKVGMLKYNIQRALDPIWMYAAFMALLWSVFAALVWIARGFKTR